jgi:hypothetical protein
MVERQVTGGRGKGSLYRIYIDNNIVSKVVVQDGGDYSLYSPPFII